MELMNSLIEARLSRMLPQGTSRHLIQDSEHMIKGTLQELVLYALAQTHFFDRAAFLGGTALRIFFQLDRFSEDLDFSLVTEDPDFSLAAYTQVVQDVVQSFGIRVVVEEMQKSDVFFEQCGFLDTGTKEFLLTFYPDHKEIHGLRANELLNIKFKMNVRPPKGAGFEYHSGILPTFYRVRLYDGPSLFAGNIHAILCRPWTQDPKGRDLYDFFFYIQMGTPVNLFFLENTLKQTGHLPPSQTLTLPDLQRMLIKTFQAIDFQKAKRDIIPLINQPVSDLSYWSSDIFCELVSRLRISSIADSK